MNDNSWGPSKVVSVFINTSTTASGSSLLVRGSFKDASRYWPGRLSAMVSTSNFRALVFDLGGVLLEWDRHSIHAISPEQFLTIAHSTAWHRLERGNITLKEACQVTTVSLENTESTD